MIELPTPSGDPWEADTAPAKNQAAAQRVKDGRRHGWHDRSAFQSVDRSRPRADLGLPSGMLRCGPPKRTSMHFGRQYFTHRMAARTRYDIWYPPRCAASFPDRMRMLDATMTRRTQSGDIFGPSQRVDVMTALKTMTNWPAWQHFEEDQKGSIEVGKLADFVLLSKDPTMIDLETLDSLQFVWTIKEDSLVYAFEGNQRRWAANTLTR